MNVNPEAFVDAMSRHWKALGNADSEAFRAVWRQLAQTLNGRIEAYGTPAWQKWFALRPETGTGKTQGVCLYASMLPRADHPGVLIVVRLKEQANEVAATINQMAGAEVAKARHTDSRLERSEATATPVLVITHEAFKRGLVAENEQGDTYNWHTFTSWQGGMRRLVVIDEELDLLQEAQITIGDVLQAKSILLTTFPNQFPEQVATLNKLEGQMLEIEKEREDNKSEHVLWSEWAGQSTFNVAPIINALPTASLTKDELRQAAALFTSIELTVRSWCWQSRKAAGQGKPAVIALNSARLMTDHMPCGAVVLDATADVDVSYQLFGDDRLQVIGRPASARRYSNVTLHLSHGWRMGKHARLQTKEQDVAKLMGHLKATLSPERKVLIVTHLDLEPAFKAHEAPFLFEVAHWNALDGRNDWRDFDAVVIFTLPYRPTEWAPNVFMAARGPQGTEWLQSKEHRRFGAHRDIRNALNTGKIATQVIQAINRVRCRRVVNAAGDCDPTDVFMLVPAVEGMPLVSKIKEAMPAIQTVTWSLKKSQSKSQPSKYDDRLLHVAKRMKPGTQLAGGYLYEALGDIPKSARERLIRRLEKRGPLADRLRPLGVVFTKKISGGRPINCIVKA